MTRLFFDLDRDNVFLTLQAAEAWAAPVRTRGLYVRITKVVSLFYTDASPKWMCVVETLDQ